MPTTDTSATLDGRGRSITTFVVYEATQRLDGMQDGETLEILTGDFERFETDIPDWCRTAGHRFQQREPSDQDLRFAIEKRNPEPSGRKLAMIVSADIQLSR